MDKIKILLPHEAQKIAAGEVIERPANIVKELMENALDAGATQIIIYIEKAGKDLIRLIDNGCGMSANDAHHCFLPHATSKITSLNDLEHIATFGFRGEALASIAAVSTITLQTKLTDTQLGTVVTYSQGTCIQQEACACPQGTDINIKNLFDHIPVRKKFLKQDTTEWHAIQTLIYAFCLSHPSITCKLYHDGKLMLNAPSIAHAHDRASQLWDVNFAQNLIPLKQSEQHPLYHFNIQGFISKHMFWRYGRDAFFFFVNQRWIKNQ
jgi:DNA mismatch repair protein MutL